MIAATPSTDPHAHLHYDEPGAPDLANLPSAHWIQTELGAVHRMRDTAIDWCRFRIFRDLYDINEPHLTESNSHELFDKVARSGQDPAWAPLLHGRCNIRTVVTSLGNRSADPSKDRAPSSPCSTPITRPARHRHRADAVLRRPDHEGRI